MTAEDIPAAHSMDTEWFAIDADGHVGVFVTGEDGAVPETFTGEGEPPDFVAQAFVRGWIGADASLIAGARVTEDPVQHAWFVAEQQRVERTRRMFAERVARWQAMSWWRRWRRRGEAPRPQAEQVFGGLLVMDGRASAPKGAVQRSGGLQVVRPAAMSLDELTEIHRAGRCLGCGWLPEIEEQEDVMMLAGIFSFAPEIDYSGQLLSPYRRVTAPPRPRTVAEFEAGFVAQLHAVRLTDAHFDRDELIQPARRVVCVGYGGDAPGYIDVDLATVRAQAGLEKQYLASVEAWERQMPGFRFIRP
jgi:hypothetical protein